MQSRKYLKLRSKSIRYFQSFKEAPCKTLINDKGKNSDSLVEKCARHHLDQANVTSDRTGNRHHVSPMCCSEQDSIISVVFLPKMANLNIIMRKQTNTKWKAFYKINALWSLKSNKDYSWQKRLKKRLRKCSKWRESSKETWQVNILQDPGWEFFFYYNRH